MRRMRFARELATALGLLGLCATAVQAVVIAPVLVEISPTHRVASITVSNPDGSPVSYQAQVLSWQQLGGSDQYEPTDQLIVVPPIAEIAAGGSQIFRVTTRLPPGPQEAAFRLVLEDVTQSVTAEPTNAMHVELRVNHNLPVFFAAAGNPRAEPRVSPCGDPPNAGRGCVRIENAGNQFTVVKTIALSNGSWRHDLPVSTRVLSGGWKQWEFDLPSHLSGSLQVTAETSAGPVSGALPGD